MSGGKDVYETEDHPDAGEIPGALPARIGSHNLAYREDNLMYYDTYLGGDRFAGEEALWISDVPYWSMNYIGRVTGSPFSGDFLKEALLHAAVSLTETGICVQQAQSSPPDAKKPLGVAGKRVGKV